VIESVTVDGLNPPNEMYLALEKFEKDPTIEVIIFARGGGDPLGMLMFSDEKLVRSVFKCKKPVISAIGHEQDNPLLDYVADVRASTPTDVAKHLVPSWVDELGQIDSSNQLLNVLIKRIFNVNENEINKLMLRFGSPTIIFSNQEKEINESFHRILQIINQRVHNEEKHLIDLPKVCFDAINRNVHDEQIAVLQNISKLNAFINVINNESLKIDGMMQKINLMHPNNILKRGYALVSQNNKIISSINDLSVKQEMRIDLIDGHVISTIKSKGGKNG
jgi:exodeoxyribonuclease VII large subunit